MSIIRAYTSAVTKAYTGAVKPGSGLNQTPIPSASKALVYLDGTILDVAGTKYFVDKKSGKNFLITNYDFDSSVTVGFPYKSQASISAPAADAALIAADVNNYLYASDGTPNQIQVVSLFQDIEYEHKIFCRHAAQIVDANGIETYEPRVLDITVYSDSLASADLATAITYFSVPVEDISTMVWLSPSGDDTTGNGTKATPYKTLSKIVATTKTNVYLKTGDYSPAAMLTFTGASAVNIIGTGLSSFTTPALNVGITANKGLTFKHCVITSTGSNYAFYFTNSLYFESCKITKADATAFILTDNGCINIDIINCITNANHTSGLILSNRALTHVNINGNFGTFKTNCAVGYVIITAEFKYNKATGTSTPLLAASTLTYKDNKGFTNPSFNSTTGLCTISNETIANSLTLNGNVVVDACVITGSIVGSIKQIINSTVNGNISLIAVANAKYNNNTITTTSDITPLDINAAVNANIIGVEVIGNTITGNRTVGYIVYIGPSAFNEMGVNAINAPTVKLNKIENITVGAGTNHTLCICGGIDPVIKYNKIICKTQYAFVVKSGNVAYATSDAHFSYNIVKCTGAGLYLICARSANGIIVANNFISTGTATNVFYLDGDNGAMTVKNNLVNIGGNISGSVVTGNLNASTSHNAINKNGYTAAIVATDFEISTVINADGIPASKVEHAEAIAGDNDTGLASDYSIPNAPTYQDQGATWQNGAVILP